MAQQPPSNQRRPISADQDWLHYLRSLGGLIRSFRFRSSSRSSQFILESMLAHDVELNLEPPTLRVPATECPCALMTRCIFPCPQSELPSSFFAHLFLSVLPYLCCCRPPASVWGSSLPCPARHKLIAHQKHQKRPSYPDYRAVTHQALPETPAKPDIALQS